MTRPTTNSLSGRWGALAAVLASALLLFWVADGIRDMESSPGYSGHYYEYLVDGFLHGHTYLSVEPLPQLALLKNPYDPHQNAAYRLPDASYYGGKYYLYYGPTPAVTLMLPWRLLTGTHMPERVAAVVFSAIALAGLGLLLLEVRARYFPLLSGWAVGAIVLVCMHAAWLPVLLRRPGFWELPHAAALACLWWALFFLWRCRIEPGRALWGAALGVCLALMLGARPTYLFASAALAILACVPPRAPGRPAGIPWRTGIAVALPLLAGGVSLILYNVLRFGRASEFGQSYQLLNVDELHLPHFRPAFLVYNIWIYLESVTDLSPYFPFVKTVWPGTLPQGYVMSEEMHGLFFALPVQFAGLAALTWVWGRRRQDGVAPLAFTLAGGVLTSAFAACVLFSWAGASSRYMTELDGGWTFAAGVGLMALFAPAPGLVRRPWRTAAVRFLALSAATWSVAYVWLASFEHGGLFRHTNPVAYSRMARVLDFPSLWAARRDRVVFGPVELTLRLAPYRGPAAATLLASGRLDMMNRLVIRRTDAAHVRLSLVENDSVVASLDGLDVESGEITVRVEAPWLYPPPEHPYWDRVPNTLERADRQSRFGLHASGRSAVAYSSLYFDPTGFEPYQLVSDEGAGAWVATLRHLSKSAP